MDAPDKPALPAAPEPRAPGSSYNLGLTPLKPAYRSVIAIRLLVPLLALLGAAVAVGAALDEELGIDRLTVIGPVAALAIALFALLPQRLYRRWGYDLSPDELRVLRGFLWRTDTIVPMERVQHIDVAQGPLARAFGLSTLVVHTAGTHNSTVALPGLATADAEAMREAIKARIGADPAIA